VATKRVITYVMHEAEAVAAERILDNPVETQSYVMGDVDESRIPELQALGLIVEEIDTSGDVVTGAQARRSMSTASGRKGFAPAAAQDMAEPEPGVVTDWLLRLDGPLLDYWRDQIDGTGAHLAEYVPKYAYVALATPEQATELVNLDFVLECVRFDRTRTGAIPLTAGATAPRPAPRQRGRGLAPAPPPAPPETQWDLWLASAKDRQAVVDQLVADGVEVVGSGGRKVRVRAHADDERLAAASDNPNVLTVMEHVPPKLHNDVACGLLGILDNTGAAAIPWDGKGQIVGVADTGIDVDHPDFKGRIKEAVALGRKDDVSDPIGHGTHVAGSVLGDGRASKGKYRGAAPKATLFFQSLVDAEGELGGLPVALAELFDAAYNAGARVHNNSWGSATESAYTVDSTEVDDYIAAHRDMLIVVSAGNDGTAAKPRNAKAGAVDWLSIGSPASCKNALTVGAARSSRQKLGYAESTYNENWPDRFPIPGVGAAKVSGDPQAIAAFSSRGPCDDRRIKPDLVAPGTDILSCRSSAAPADEFWGEFPENDKYAFMGGTSMAAPLVSGCAALVRQFYVDEQKVKPSAALLKATLINGTTWLSGDDALADFPNAPNYNQGFGALNMASTLPHPGAPGLALSFVDTWQKQNLQFSRTGQRFRFSVQVAPGPYPLRICVAYTDLPARGLQNDLSLLVQGPTKAKWVGNAEVPQGMGIPDPDNNVEIVRIEAPDAGKYLIQVYCRNLLRGPQDFALVVTGNLGGTLKRVPD
jgi:subtilisin family serine protease